MGFQTTTIVGNLGKDPEVRYDQAGKAICKFSVAVSEKGKNGSEHTEWFNVTTFDKLAENCGQYLQKGRQCLVVGRLKTSEYEKDGQKRRFTELLANTVQFLGGAPGGNAGGVGGTRSESPASNAPPAADGFIDDDLPF